MLLEPEERSAFHYDVLTQMLQAQLAEPAKFEPEDEQPFDVKMRYFIHLKTQDVLNQQRANDDARDEEAPADALVRLLAYRRQMTGPWTPRCGAPPVAGLTHREQHRMEQRVYGTTALARGELYGLQALGQLVGGVSGAGGYLLLAPPAHRLCVLLEAGTPAEPAEPSEPAAAVEPARRRAKTAMWPCFLRITRWGSSPI